MITMTPEQLKQAIGQIILDAVAKDFVEKTGNNYDLNDYVNDFEGSEHAIMVALIKHAARVL